MRGIRDDQAQGSLLAVRGGHTDPNARSAEVSEIPGLCSPGKLKMSG